MKAHMQACPMVFKASVLTFVLLIAAPLLAGAQYYRYTDETGSVRYTDDLLQVPKAQRSGVKEVEKKEAQPEDSPPLDESSLGETVEKSEPMDQSSEEEPVEKADQPGAGDSKQVEFERLSQEKQMLDEEFDALIKTKNDLTQKKDEMDINVYNEQVRQLNERIDAYDKKRSEFEKASQAFNATLKP